MLSIDESSAGLMSIEGSTAAFREAVCGTCVHLALAAKLGPAPVLILSLLVSYCPHLPMLATSMRQSKLLAFDRLQCVCLVLLKSKRKTERERERESQRVTESQSHGVTESQSHRVRERERAREMFESSLCSVAWQK